MSATTSLSKQTQATSNAQEIPTGVNILRFVVGGLLALTVICYVIFLSAALNFRAQPFPGFLTSNTLTVNAGQATSSEIWTGIQAGLQRQDHIIAINGTPLGNLTGEAQANFHQFLRNSQIGDEITVTFERLESQLQDATPCASPVDGVATCRTTFQLAAFPGRDFLAYFLLPYAAGIMILFISVVLFRYRNRQYDGLITVLIALFSAIYVGGIFDVGTTRTLTPLWLTTATLLGGVLVTFSLMFPTRLNIVERTRVYSISIVGVLPIAISLVLWLGILNTYFNPVNAWDNSASQSATIISMIGLMLFLVFGAVLQRPRATTAITRDQINSLLIGGGLMAIPALMWVGNRALIAFTQIDTPINFESLLPLYIFPNAAMAYAVMQYRRFDSDEILSQSITYMIMLGALIFAVFVMTLGSTLLALDFFNTNSAFGIAAILFVMVMFFTPIRNRLQNRINAVYYRSRRDYQSHIETFAQNLTNQKDYSDIVQVLRDTLQDTIQPKSTLVFLLDRNQDLYTTPMETGHMTDVHFSTNSEMIALLRDNEHPIPLKHPLPPAMRTERARLNILKARVIAPIISGDDLTGFIIFGAPSSGAEIYDYEQMRFIGNLVGQFAAATERSQVIQSLERRVRELDVLSRVGQAVNFDIKFDDLLELINAQTTRIIDAPCFYIALYDEASKQLYFALFQEDDNRYAERENRRWELDNGVFSDIITSKAGRNLESYAAEMKRRMADLRFISPELQAFMGVPLTGNRGTLGVMALGKMTNESPYTDEQFTIFSNIGSLAATSIDKAQLFERTRVRERQLTLLNEISQQLVATESDVERLLQLIMSSSVDILNAEAGSLLLTTDEVSENALVFRVVIGGAGDALVGQRIALDSGVAGQVATSGEAIIVNNVQQDPRHTLDVGDSQEFQANTMIAVPLKVKKEVIGVLQVLNKKDGTPFFDEDSELLETFASQAAIAIENARRYSMTEVQLEVRVSELEALEHIDRELNRTLDLHEVAGVTVRSAMQMLKAQGGLLGMVRQDLEEEETYLEVIAIEGYEEDDYPTGADGLRWPLDGGILGRVMRNRQADIVTDVSIDPNYETGIKGSISQITIPMMTGRDISAVLILEKNTTPPFSLSNWGFAQRIAEHASVALANAELYAALELANKSKSEFMGFVAHELKNPLASIKGWADVLRSGMAEDLSEQQRSFVNIIHSNSARMQTILDDLRAAAQLDANEFKVEPQPMNIRSAIIESLRPFTHTFEDKGQTLINNVPESLPMVMGDETRLIQVLTNLVSNANKYSPENTTITISAKQIDDHIDHKGNHYGESLRVSVTDEGIGMSKEDQKSLFRERYFRSTNPVAQEKPGTGLGMVLTYEIIKRHKGDIWIESELGEGSTFNFVVPLATEEKQAQSAQKKEIGAD